LVRLYLQLFVGGHVLLRLFMFVCVQWWQTHVVLWICFVFPRRMYPTLPVSLDCPLLIAPSVLSNACFSLLTLQIISNRNIANGSQLCMP
jgi:hypothetical protein